MEAISISLAQVEIPKILRELIRLLQVTVCIVSLSLSIVSNIDLPREQLIQMIKCFHAVLVMLTFFFNILLAVDF